MMKIVILINMQFIRNIVILILMIIANYGQNIDAQVEKVAGEIKWGSPKEIEDPTTSKNIHILYFEHAVYNNRANHLPYFQNMVRLTSESEKISIQFSNLYFEEIKPEEVSLIQGLNDIPDTITLNSSMGQERKQPILIYSFVPLRKNPQTGKIERLRFFSLKITRTKGMDVLKSTSSTTRYAVQSVLSTGDWYKFYVKQSGVYQITYNDLKNLGISNPADVRIYGNGGKVLPEVYSGNTEDDLKEIPILMVTGSDGVFSDGDYILFYAEGPVTWSYDKIQKTYAHHKNPFIGVPNSDDGRVPYFITLQAGGAKIQTDTETYGTPTIQVNSFDGLAFHEKNEYNFLQSGQAWYGEAFNLQTTYDFSFTFQNLVTSEPLYIESEVLGRSGVNNYFSFSQNNNNIGTVAISPVSIGNSLALYGQTSVFKGSFNASSDNISLEINYNNGGDPAGGGWLTYLRLVARENLIQSSPQFTFRDSRSVASGNIAQFTISNSTADTRVWNVTDINHPLQMKGLFQNTSYLFTAKTDSLREFVAFNLKTGLLTPEFIQENNGKIPNQNLHGLKYSDLLIISPPDFITEAQRLADLHFQKDGISYTIVTPDQIYNEFSSGKPDPAAIRNFIKMFYDRANSPDEIPKYLLLFGDGSYDNRYPFSADSKNTNFIITYESANSLDPTNTFVSDDYFGLLDDNESIVNAPFSGSPYTTALLDIGIGRIPVDSLSQATAVVNKIEKYMNNKSMGDWRNSICFVGDDEDDNIHMEQADQLATYVSQNYPTFNVEKIYLDAYQQVSTSTGDRYPDVNLAILNQLNKGLLIFNYTGHGGESGLAQEQIMQQNGDINQWNNDNYPLFVTATCDFARFDRWEGVTAGEDVLLNPHGGGIGLLTTNRLVYSAPNFVLNQQFYDVAFVKSNDNKAFRLGDIIRKTKNGSGIDINKLNFALLGDPALSLAFPKYNVVTDSINQKPVAQADTLKAYGSVTIKGHIEDQNGSLLNNYKGVVAPVLFDKSREITTLANDGGTPFVFNLQDKVLFKGKATVRNGNFTVNFILPRDMDYSYGFGRLSYYANDSTTDAAGYYNQIPVGGMNTSITIDSIGPKIKLYMNDTTFINGGITDAYPTLLARVYDDHGINPGGNSLGHDITATLDQDPKQVYILNSYFQADIDNYKQGSVAFKFPELSPGKHTVTFKIWDIFNNSSQAELNFVVVNENSPSIQRVFNYPNPFSDNTNFFFEHNQTSENLNVTIEIFGLSGNKVREINTTLSSSGFTSGPINWDGRDGNGNKILSGIYIYRVILRSLLGTAVSNAQKMVVIRQ
jgi:hypothetical protein